MSTQAGKSPLVAPPARIGPANPLAHAAQGSDYRTRRTIREAWEAHTGTRRIVRPEPAGTEP